MECQSSPLEGMVIMQNSLDQFYRGKSVLLTGHTGFKGAWVSLWLSRLGARVIGYSLTPPTDPNFFELCNMKEQIINIEGDIRNIEHLQQTIQDYRPEIVFHMAAQSLVRKSYQDPVETFSSNVMGTVNLLEAVRRSDCVRSAVIITSDKCYENQEWVWPYREGDRLGGYDPYSSSKACAELVSEAYVRSFFNPRKYNEYGLALATARAGNVIGGGDWAEDRLIPDCIKAIINHKPIIIRNPLAVRPWQHVLDPLHGYLQLGQALYEKGPDINGPWNFGPRDKAKSVQWMVENLTRQWGEEAAWTLDQNANPHEAHFLKLDSSKAYAGLGWQAVWDTQKALEQTIAWYKAYVNNENLLAFSLDQIHDYEKSWIEMRGRQ